MTQEAMAIVEEVLEDLVEQARAALGGNLVSVVLFGSAAEGRLRPTSDVNLLFLLESFEASAVDSLRDALRVARVAVKVEAMFLLRGELALAADTFAVKFNDMAGRHRLLWGEDIFAETTVSPEALARRLREVLLNLAIRLRERYVVLSLREEQLAREIAQCAGPMRAAATALRRLRGESATSPREALESLVAGLGEQAFVDAVAILPRVRENPTLAAGEGGPVLLALSRLASRLIGELEGVTAAGSVR